VLTFTQSFSAIFLEASNPKGENKITMDNMSGGKTALGLDNNVGSLVCYLNICIPAGFIYSIIVLVTDKVNKIPRFHAMQSLLWTGVTVVVLIILQVFIAVFAVATQSGGLATLLGLFVWVIALGATALGIFAGYKGYQGELFKLPVIGDMADKWSN
jgi:uncharacterized membrane protein